MNELHSAKGYGGRQGNIRDCFHLQEAYRISDEASPTGANGN